MRVDTQNITSVSNTGGSEAIQSSGVNSRSGNGGADQISNDTVALSTASSLVALARGLNSADRQSRVSSFASQVRSGQYQPSDNDLSQALISSLRPGGSAQ